MAPRTSRSGKPYSGEDATNRMLDAIEEKDFYVSQAKLCFKALKDSGVARRKKLAEIEEQRISFKYGRAYEKSNEKEIERWGKIIQDRYIPKAVDEETGDLYQTARHVLMEIIASQRLTERQAQKITHDENGSGKTYSGSSKVQ